MSRQRRRGRLPVWRIAFVGLIILAIWWAASRDDLTGAAEVHDGDTLTVAGERIRLYAIDAPELNQTCEDRAGATYACGRLAKRHLDRLARGPLRCEEIERDRYDRSVAICWADGRDLGAEMVSAGWARAYLSYSLRYASAEQAAQNARRGMWDGTFEAPWAYREDGFKDDLIAILWRWVWGKLL